MLDKFDYLLLEIVHENQKSKKSVGLKLNEITNLFYLKVDNEHDAEVRSLKLGEKIANLYLKDFILNKNGYLLTKKGKNEVLNAMMDA